MRYGLPYKGSKNKIALKIIDALPPAKHFYDLFAGGCSIAHAAILSGKYEFVHINDIDPRPTQLFLDAIGGKYHDEKRWISREDFFRLKDSDAYVCACWSFGGDAQTYLYGRAREPWKKALHYARVFGDRSLLLEMGIESDGSRKDIREHFEEYCEKYIAWFVRKFAKSIEPERLRDRHFQRLEHLERLQSLESLEHLERRIVRTALPYDKIKIESDDALIYCDPPYRGKSGYAAQRKEAFDYEAFYQWAEAQTVPVVISEYEMP